MQSQKEKCEVLSKFYARAAELGFDVAMKLFQFQHVDNKGWVTVKYPSQFAVDSIEFREDPFYKDWKFEPFTLKASIKVGDDGNVSSVDVSDCTNGNVMLDFDLFGVEALDNMGLFSDGVIEGVFEVSGVIEIGHGIDEFHYTCTHKQL